MNAQPPTVAILIALGLFGLLMSGVFLFLSRTAIPGVRLWFAASALLPISIGLFLLAGHAPAFISIILANALMGLVVIFQLFGYRRFLGAALRPTPPLMLWLASIAVLAHFTYGSPDLEMRVGIVSALHVALNLMSANAVRLHRPRQGSDFSYWLSIAICLAVAAVNAIRGIVYVAGGVMQSSNLEANPLNVFFMALGTLAMPALSLAFIMMVHDRSAVELERRADYDFLTNALSRRAFMRFAEAEHALSLRTGIGFALVMLDIDHFKGINDRYGHTAGDAVLRHFVQLATQSVRRSNIVGRLGGEEFGILLRATDERAARLCVERLRINTETSPCLFNGNAIAFTFSAGVALHRHAEDLDSLYGRADTALYRAKTTGRNQVVLANDEAGGSAANESTQPEQAYRSGSEIR